jgi:hypothetical protein
MRTPRRGSELVEDEPLVEPIATTQGFDLSHDPDAELVAHPGYQPSLQEPLTSPFRRERATEYGAAAALSLAALNGIGLMDIGHRPLDSLIGPDPNAYIIAQLTAVALGLGLAALVRYRHSLWVCEAVLAWSLLELWPSETRFLYGHGVSGRGWTIAAGALFFAMLGVRGAWAMRRAAKHESAPATVPDPG